MEINPVISRITIYPVKSLDGIAVQEAKVVKGGCLQYDREYAIKDENGKYINGKTNPLIYSLRSKVDFENDTLSLRHEAETKWNIFHFQKELGKINQYLSDFFGLKARLHQNNEGRFMDIPDIGGMTVLSTASLQSVSGWYDNMELEETRKRFRATIEIKGVPAFWEDRLFAEKGKRIAFKLGDLNVWGMQPRARCVVPTHHPESGEVIHAFPKIFAANRAEHLPDYSALPDYGHTYYLSVDCLLPQTETGKWIRVGDKLKIA